jgi:hypothetical protein
MSDLHALLMNDLAMKMSNCNNDDAEAQECHVYSIVTLYCRPSCLLRTDLSRPMALTPNMCAVPLLRWRSRASFLPCICCLRPLNMMLSLMEGAVRVCYPEAGSALPGCALLLPKPLSQLVIGRGLWTQTGHQPCCLLFRRSYVETTQLVACCLGAATLKLHSLLVVALAQL